MLPTQLDEQRHFGVLNCYMFIILTILFFVFAERIHKSTLSHSSLYSLISITFLLDMKVILNWHAFVGFCLLLNMNIYA